MKALKFAALTIVAVLVTFVATELLMPSTITAEQQSTIHGDKATVAMKLANPVFWKNYEFGNAFRIITHNDSTIVFNYIHPLTERNSSCNINISDSAGYSIVNWKNTIALSLSRRLMSDKILEKTNATMIGVLDNVANK